MPVKSPEQQATLALHTARTLLVKQQIMIRQQADHPAAQQAGPGGPAGLANAMRSLGAEVGLVVPQGLGRLGELVTLMEADAGVPETAGQALRALHRQFRAAREAAAGLEAALVAHARQDETARRLATIVANGNDPVPQGTDRAMTRSVGPGVGPIAASLIAVTVTDIGLFKSARHFAARAGLPARVS